MRIIAESRNIYFDEEPANAGVSYIDFVNGETAAVLNGTLECSYNYRKGDPVWDYEILVSGVTADNYDVIFETGVLSVLRKKLARDTDFTITFKNNYIYNGGPQYPDIVFQDYLKEDVDYTCKFYRNGVETEDFTSVGRIDLDIIGLGNYTGTSGFLYTINKETPVVTAVCADGV